MTQNKMEMALGQAAGAWQESANRPDIGAEFHNILKEHMAEPLAVPQIIRENSELLAMLSKGVQNVTERKFNPDRGEYVTYLGPNSLTTSEVGLLMAHTVLAFGGKNFHTTPSDGLDPAQKEQRSALLCGMTLLAPHLGIKGNKDMRASDFFRACRDASKGILFHAGTPNSGKMDPIEQSLYDKLSRLTVEMRAPLSRVLAAARAARSERV